MCDEHYEEDLANYSRFPPMTRRQLAAASLGVGVAVMLPRTANAQAVKESDAFTSGARIRYHVQQREGAGLWIPEGNLKAPSSLTNVAERFRHEGGPRGAAQRAELILG